MDEGTRRKIFWIAVCAYIIIMMVLIYFNAQQTGSSNEVIIIQIPDYSSNFLI
ncbi:hypothetical protein KAS31_02705 [Candidatus Parcubacteria bacterium]|nr:hypothetical protein [Candidatus Parcubacteria bacterium]MCK5085727.1 hypothetical protein [Candidatus Parcubacteria bacterium]